MSHRWIEKHGDLPKNYKEKLLLKEIIRDGMRKDENDFPIGEENFEEAINAVNTSVARTNVPTRVMEILNDDRCINLTAKVWIPFTNLCAIKCYSNVLINLPIFCCCIFEISEQFVLDNSQGSARFHR